MVSTNASLSATIILSVLLVWWWAMWGLLRVHVCVCVFDIRNSRASRIFINHPSCLHARYMRTLHGVCIPFRYCDMCAKDYYYNVHNKNASQGRQHVRHMHDMRVHRTGMLLCFIPPVVVVVKPQQQQQQHMLCKWDWIGNLCDALWQINVQSKCYMLHISMKLKSGGVVCDEEEE